VLGPADRVEDYKAAHPKFGMFGSIKPQKPAQPTGRLPSLHVHWMIHIFRTNPAFKDVFSMNDDVAHVR